MKVYVMYDKETRKVLGWGSTKGTPDALELDFPEDSEFLRNPFVYKVVDGYVTRDDAYLLQEVKDRKRRELGEACKQAILAGFSHEINGQAYHFSLDAEAQLNFQGAERMLSEGLVTTLMWTVKKNGKYERIPINKALMDELSLAILSHKNNNISKYRDFLLPVLEGASSLEEVSNIQW